MTNTPDHPKKTSEINAERRRMRQEEMLRENLKRRKGQGRARRAAPSAMDTGNALDDAPGDETADED